MFDPSMYLPNPYYPCGDHLDRRWRRCGYLISHGRTPSYTLDDAVTWEGWRFRLILEQADRQWPNKDSLAVAEAYRLFTTPTPVKRWEVEARLLAKETNAGIAAKCGLSIEAVHIYGKLFYDVRARLSADTHVYTVVLKGKGISPIAPDDFETLLKLFGYAKGGCAVDQVLAYISDPPLYRPALADLTCPR